MNRVGLFVLLVGLIQLPIYRGGNAAWPPIILACTCAISILLAGLITPPQRHRSKASLNPIAIALWLAWLGWLAAQIIPLPREVLAALSPYALPFHDAVAVAGGSPRYSLSVTPAASLQKLFLSLTYFMVYLAVSLQIRDQRTVRLLLWTMFLAACLESLYASLHLLANVTISLLETPDGHQHVATGSFPNRNHFAAFCTVGFAAGLSLMLGMRSSAIIPSDWRTRLRLMLDTISSSAVLVRIGLLGLVIGIVLSRSRMGNTALAVGISAFALVWLLSTRKSRSFVWAFALFLSIAAADILLISDRFGLESVLQRIESTDLDAEVRTVGNGMSKQLLSQTKPIGSGVGSYPFVAETVRPPGIAAMFRHAHNDYYQFSIETGFVGLALLGCLLGYHLLLALMSLRSRRNWVRANAAAGIMIISAGLLHATVEFNFQIPAYAAYFVSFLALLSTQHKSAF